MRSIARLAGVTRLPPAQGSTLLFAKNKRRAHPLGVWLAPAADVCFSAEAEKLISAL